MCLCKHFSVPDVSGLGARADERPVSQPQRVAASFGRSLSGLLLRNLDNFDYFNKDTE